MKRNDVLTIPNLLTGIRILLIPFFLYCYLNRQEATAALVIIICGITDFLDGFIARRFHMVSEFGKKLDPIADKLLQLALLPEHRGCGLAAQLLGEAICPLRAEGAKHLRLLRPVTDKGTKRLLATYGITDGCSIVPTEE